MSIEDYRRLRDSQRNRCAICNQQASGEFELLVDHHHGTNLVRGLLCLTCNTGLGMAMDSVVVLSSMIDYLNRTEKLVGGAVVALDEGTKTMVEENDTPILAGSAQVVLPTDLIPDVVIVDPPYHSHVHKNAVSQDQHTDGGVRHNDFGFAPLTQEFRTWVCQLAAKAKRWSVIYTDIESVSDWKLGLEAAGATYIRTLPWVRFSMPQLSGDRPPHGFECLVVAHGPTKGRKHWNGAGNLTHLAHPFESWKDVNELLAMAADGDIHALTHIEHLSLRGAKKHATEKPLDQLLDLVSWFSDRNELVVDPCAGSGTTGLACKILGRNFIGCELDAEWWEKSNARIHSCNPGDLPGSLSPRDSERFLRWVTTSEKEAGNAKERKANTDRVRKRLKDKKIALGIPGSILSVVPTPPLAPAETPSEALAVIKEALVDVTNWARKSVDILFIAQTQNGKVETMTIPTAWTEAYQRCLTDLRPPLGGGRADGAGAPEPAAPSVATARPPLTSAAERTVSLFHHLFGGDEHVAKKWREAYERAITELTPPLSAALRARLAEKKKPGICGPGSLSPTGATGPDCGIQSLVPAGLPGDIPTGIIPPHVFAELGMHPALVDEPIRVRAQVIARHERWPDDWIHLQVQAPVGFFARVLKEMDMVSGERLTVLAEAMQERGLRVGVYDVAGWSRVQRGVARSWIEQGSEQPPFLDQYADDQAGILGSCAACGREDRRPYTHTCEKGLAMGEMKQVDTPSTKIVRPGVVCQACKGTGYNAEKTKCLSCNGHGKANEAGGFYDPSKACETCHGAGCNDAGEDCVACVGSGHSLLPAMIQTEPAKRGKGRPPGAKNKAPREWKTAYTRVMAELAPAS